MTDKTSDSRFRTGGGLDALTDIDRAKLDNLEGRVLGDYRVTGLIAEGGMGRVFRAERTDGSFEREVAIKVSAISNVSNKMHERFQLEQSLLAGLNHPNIAQLFDARVSEEGWPYFVMEYVDGGAIDKYCETGALSINERVRLLISIVDAVAYAHSRLVIHRDLKPSNVLVTSDGRAKLLDFGIAKLLESDNAELSRVVPLTPRYASPEQLLGQPVTIASDVFQLGHLIHQVLVGRPLAHDDTLAEAIARAADERSISVDADARRMLPRELVLVIEQCLRPSAHERYSDANSLRADLEALLNGYPVSAVGQSAGYRFRKLLSRNMPTTITASMALIAIVGGVSWYTWQLGVARDHAEELATVAQFEAEKSNQISEFLVTLISADDPQIARGDEPTVRSVLDSGVEKIRTELEGQEQLQAELRLTLGRVYNEIGEYDKAGSLLEDAVEYYRSPASDDPTALAKVLFVRAQHLRDKGDLKTIVDTLNEALSIARMQTSREAQELQASIMNTLAGAHNRRNEFDDAERHFLESIALKTELFGPDHVETSVPIANYAMVLWSKGRYEEALQYYESSYKIAVDELGPYHPWIAPRALNLGRAYRAYDRMEEAEELLRVALDQDRHVYGDNHPNVASSLQSLGVHVFAQSDREEGVRIIEEGLAIEEASLGNEHIYTNQTRSLLANYYITMEQYSEAEILLDKAKAGLKASVDGDHVYVADMHWYRGRLYRATGRTAQAIDALRNAIGITERLYGENSGHMAGMLTELANVYQDEERFDEAYATYSRFVGMMEANDAAKDYHYEDLQMLKESADARR